MFKVLLLGAITGLAVAGYVAPAADPTPAYQPAADTATAPAYGVAANPPTTGYVPANPVPVYYQPQVFPVFPRRHHHHHSSSNSHETHVKWCRAPKQLCKNDSNCEKFDLNNYNWGDDDIEISCTCSNCAQLLLLNENDVILSSSSKNITYTATCGKHSKWRKNGNSFIGAKCLKFRNIPV